LPTGIGSTIPVESASIRTTLVVSALVTQIPPPPIAIPTGYGPTGIVCGATLRSRSIRVTVPSIVFATHAAF